MRTEIRRLKIAEGCRGITQSREGRARFSRRQ